MPARVATVVLATLAGGAAWLTLGALAVVDAASRARVGIVPPWWMLAGLVATFTGVALARGATPARLAPLGLSALAYLPWLPGRVPAAFLIWHGHVLALVWLAIAIGLTEPWWGVWARRLAGWSTARASAVLAAVMLLAFLFGARGMRTQMPSGDEPHYLIITQSLLLDGDLRIENNHRRGDHTAYVGGELPPDYLRRGLDGEIYSIHAPGISALVLPAFALGGYQAVLLILALASSLAAVLAWRVAWAIGGDAVGAWFASTGVWLATPMFFQAFAVFPDAAGAGLTMVGLWSLVRLELRRSLRTSQLLAVGTALALLPWLHTRFALIAGLLGTALGLRLLTAAGWRAVVAFLLVPAMSAVGWFGYFWSIWGTPSPAAPYGGYTQSSVAHWLEGVPGLLFDQQFGLFSTAPVLLVALAGLAPLARRHPRLAIETGTLAAGYLLAVAAYRMWWGGYSSPARFLVAVVPVAVLPLTLAWQSMATPGRAVAAALWVLTIVGVVTRAAVEQGALLFNLRDGVDLTLDWLNRLVSLPLAAPSLHRDPAAVAGTDILIWCVSGLACVMVATRVAARVGMAWLMAWLAVAGTVMMASTLAWRRQASPALVTVSAAGLDLVRRWPALIVGSGWQSRPYRAIDASEVPPRLSIEGAATPREGDGRVALLRVPRIPAGRYEVQVAGSSRLDGVADVRVGRTTQALDRLALGPGPAQVIDLPVAVHSLVIAAEPESAGLVERVALRPLAVGSGPLPPEGYAIRASRFGDVRCFLLDERAYMEPGGLWTRGGQSTTLVVDVRRPHGSTPWAPPTLVVRAGAVAVRTRLRAGDWETNWDLAPGASEQVTLPGPPDRDWVIEVETDNGFRPVDHDPNSRDQRFLGVRLEFPASADAGHSPQNLTTPLK